MRNFTIKQIAEFIENSNYKIQGIDLSSDERNALYSANTIANERINFSYQFKRTCNFTKKQWYIMARETQKIYVNG